MIIIIIIIIQLIFRVIRVQSLYRNYCIKKVLTNTNTKTKTIE